MLLLTREVVFLRALALGRVNPASPKLLAEEKRSDKKKKTPSTKFTGRSYNPYINPINIIPYSLVASSKQTLNPKQTSTPKIYTEGTVP